MDCLPGLSGRLAHLQSSNILTTKMKSLLAELNMRYFNSANRLTVTLIYIWQSVPNNYELNPKKNGANSKKLKVTIKATVIKVLLVKR